MRPRREKSDVAIRHWALERALTYGGVSTAQLRDYFDLTLQSAAKRLAGLRNAGYLELDDGRRNIITDEGRVFLQHNQANTRKRFNDSPLCAALGLFALPVGAGRTHKLE